MSLLRRMMRLPFTKFKEMAFAQAIGLMPRLTVPVIFLKFRSNCGEAQSL